jgi:hypothetical protein
MPGGFGLVLQDGGAAGFGRRIDAPFLCHAR